MSKKVKIFLSVLIFLGLIGYVGYNYVMFGGARNLEEEQAEFTVSSTKLISEFNNNTDASNKKYLEKAIAVTGKVTSVQKNEIIMDNSVFCILKEPSEVIKENTTITVKGRVVGFDDLMGEVKLDQCFIIK